MGFVSFQQKNFTKFEGEEMKKIKWFFATALVISFLFVVFVPGSIVYANRGTGTDGHWLYDQNGNHKGCESPGTDCTFS
jgi:hypothetical protein